MFPAPNVFRNLYTLDYQDIENKIEKESYENIFIKDTDKEKVKFIYAKSGKLINLSLIHI